ncbi:MAG: hypothetical protein WBI44_06550, partial [Syntrophaceticus sp.]
MGAFSYYGINGIKNSPVSIYTHIFTGDSHLGMTGHDWNSLGTMAITPQQERLLIGSSTSRQNSE